jgi:hypothetical protein
MSAARANVDWAPVIAQAYANEARPPLTEDLLAQLREKLAEALGHGSEDVAEQANAALDAFETALRSVVGPRVESLDEDARMAVMKHRSEAGQPLRAFGGQ